VLRAPAVAAALPARTGATYRSRAGRTHIILACIARVHRRTHAHGSAGSARASSHAWLVCTFALAHMAWRARRTFTTRMYALAFALSMALQPCMRLHPWLLPAHAHALHTLVCL
jgi:hypothetical protein